MANRGPLNLKILELTPERLSTVRRVSSLDIFDGMSSNFSEDGLFSVSTFGRVGSDERDRRFGVISIKARIFHPLIHKRLVQLKGFYEKIILSQAYAIWDKERGDFVSASATEEGADTGYSFFDKYWESIQFVRNRSLARNLRIDLVEKYRRVAMTDHVLVMPAGLRDIEIDEHGHTKEDEINDPYRRLIAVSNTLGNVADADNRFIDGPRVSLQRGFDTIYNTVDGLLYGKKGFIQSKYGRRKVFNGTRNTISSMDTTVSYFGGPRSMTVSSTQFGLFQTLKMLLPVAMHYLATGWLSEVFNGADSNAILVDKKTLKPEYVTVRPDTVDRWTSMEGLEKVISSYSDITIRNKPIDVEGYWLGLIYIDDRTFRLFNDIDSLPKEFDRKNVHPLNLTQLLYLCGYQRWYNYYAYVTRFPVTGVGSMYPSEIYTRTTMIASEKYELGPDWKPLGEEFLAREFPDHLPNATFMDSQSPHPSTLSGLGADFDGDQTDGTGVYLEESLKEVKEYLGTRGYLVSPSGSLYLPADTDIITLVLNNLLSDVA